MGISINCLFPRLRRQLRTRILMYDLYTPVLRAVFPCTYVQDVRYAGFAGAKAGHAKILINRGPHFFRLPNLLSIFEID